jgi:hypothetical protein
MPPTGQASPLGLKRVYCRVKKMIFSETALLSVNNSVGQE